MAHFLLSLLMAALLLGPDCPAPDTEDAVDVYIVKHAWHAGIALPWERLEEHDYPALEEFTEGQYVEIGWGDARYYPHPQPGIATTLQAGLWPTSSTIHVAVLDENPVQRFPQTEVLHFPISEEALERLVSYLIEAHELEDDQPVVQEAGLYDGGRFFAGREKYHVFNNCNHWVARALEQAACNVNSSRTMTVEQLLSQIRRFAD